MSQQDLFPSEVEVYKNLHNGKWSIRDKKSKLILGHARKVLLSNVTPKVSEAGRQRVLKKKQKEVHAFLCGTLEGTTEFTSYKGRTVKHNGIAPGSYVGERLSYNPYQAPTFMLKLCNTPYKGSKWVFLDSAGVTACDYLKPSESYVATYTHKWDAPQ